MTGLCNLISKTVRSTALAVFGFPTSLKYMMWPGELFCSLFNIDFAICITSDSSKAVVNIVLLEIYLFV